MNREGGNFTVRYNDRDIRPDSTMNWGDIIPKTIINFFSKSNKLTNEDIFSVKYPQKPYKIYSTGSVMLYTKPDSIVWGTGCIAPGRIGQTPKKIYAVRGPLTKKELDKRGISCPEIYGDPALLFPQIYNPKIEKKYKLGIIPHYIDYFSNIDKQIIKNLEGQGVKIIDVCSGEQKFIDELLEVETVVSSSLHGLIAADAYGIPNAKVNISNKLIGGNFKFNDYYLSVGRPEDNGLQLTEKTKISEIESLFFNEVINWNGDKLLNNAPWLDPDNEKLFY